MHWKQEFPTRGHAIRAANNLRALSVRQRHALPYALHGYELGSLKSVLKKVVKVAGKLSPSHQIAKALKIDKFSPSQLLASKLEASSKSSPKAAPTAAAPAPVAQEIQPTAPVSIPNLDYSQGAYLSPSGGGGGGGGAFSPAPAQAGEESGLSMPLVMGLSVAGLAIIYLLARGRK